MSTPAKVLMTGVLCALGVLGASCVTGDKEISYPTSEPTTSVPVKTSWASTTTQPYIETTTTTVVSVSRAPHTLPAVDAGTEDADAPQAEVPAAPGDVDGYVCEVFGPRCDLALRVMYCESGRAEATNGSHWGHWQISVKWHKQMILEWAEFFGLPRSVESVRDIRVGTQIAYSLSAEGTDFYAHFYPSVRCWA